MRCDDASPSPRRAEPTSATQKPTPNLPHIPPQVPVGDHTARVTAPVKQRPERPGFQVGRRSAIGPNLLSRILRPTIPDSLFCPRNLQDNQKMPTDPTLWPALSNR